MTEEADLKIGSFYWVLPVFDPDNEKQWELAEQPARFAGLNDKGRPIWNCLGMDKTSDWPMKWIGEEIVEGEKT